MNPLRSFQSQTDQRTQPALGWAATATIRPLSSDGDAAAHRGAGTGTRVSARLALLGGGGHAADWRDRVGRCESRCPRSLRAPGTGWAVPVAAHQGEEPVPGHWPFTVALRRGCQGPLPVRARPGCPGAACWRAPDSCWPRGLWLGCRMSQAWWGPQASQGLCRVLTGCRGSRAAPRRGCSPCDSMQLPASFSLVYCTLGRVFIYLILYSVITIVG